MFLFVVGSGEVVECTVGTDFSGEGVCGFVGWVAAGGGAVVWVWGCVARGLFGREWGSRLALRGIVGDPFVLSSFLAGGRVPLSGLLF